MSAAPAPAAPTSYSLIRRTIPGSAGRPFRLLTNAFNVDFRPAPNQDFFWHYDVAFTATTLGRAGKWKLIQQLQLQNVEIFRTQASYDGNKNLFATHELNMGTSPRTFEVSFQEPDGKPSRKTWTVVLTKVNAVSVRALEGLKRGEIPSPDGLTALMMINVAAKATPLSMFRNDKTAANSRSFFSSKGHTELFGIQIWHGFFQTIRPTRNRLILNVDKVQTTMYPGILAHDALTQYLGQRDLRNLERLSPQEQKKATGYLKNLRVELTHRPKVAAKAIKGLVFQSAEGYRFQKEDGTEHSIASYMTSMYDIRLAYPRLGVCASFSGSAVIPLELLRIVPGQFFKRTVPEKVMTKMLELSKTKPKVRLNGIVDSVKMFNLNVNTSLVGLQIDPKPLEIAARQLRSPSICFGGEQKVEPLPHKVGQWDARHKAFFRPKQYSVLVVVYLDNSQREDHGFILPLMETLKMRGIDGFYGVNMMRGYGHPAYQNGGIAITVSGNPQAATQILGNAHKMLLEFWKSRGETKAPDPLYIVVVSDQAATVREEVKRWAELVDGPGVTAQTVRRGKIQRENRADSQYLNNLALKINIKLGGINSKPEVTKLQATMVIGADTSHPAPGSTNPSFSAVVFSRDRYCVSYEALMKIQPSRQEAISNLDQSILHGIKRYYTENGNSLPKKMIFYRDGISEGQFRDIAMTEITAVKAAIEESANKTKLPAPKLTFIVVGKNHHFRLFPQDADADSTGNAPAGTVVDQDITNTDPRYFDFYLQSHAGLLGTSRPAHYTVIYDESEHSADALQEISFALCHVYQRATRTVSIPAPVYYADLVAGRGKLHTGADDSDSAASVIGSAVTDPFEAWKKEFKAIHRNHTGRMFWL